MSRTGKVSICSFCGNSGVNQFGGAPPIAEDLVYALIRDLAGRNGLGDAWADIDLDIKDEIVMTWKQIVRKHL